LRHVTHHCFFVTINQSINHHHHRHHHIIAKLSKAPTIVDGLHDCQQLQVLLDSVSHLVEQVAAVSDRGLAPRRSCSVGRI